MRARPVHIAAALTLTFALCACGGGGNGDGSGGSSTDGAMGGSQASGGTSTGGQAPSTGGTSTGGQAPSTGGASSGGSESGTGGGDNCGDTSSDPENCGTCGHVCEGNTCEDGECGPYPGACIRETDGFTTCDAYCASVSQTCVTQGCAGNKTAYVWPSDQEAYCNDSVGTASGASVESCDTALEFSAGLFYWRCCCTDS